MPLFLVTIQFAIERDTKEKAESFASALVAGDATTDYELDERFSLEIRAEQAHEDEEPLRSPSTMKLMKDMEDTKNRIIAKRVRKQLRPPSDSS